MVGWETSIIVKRPILQVFAFVTDPRQGPKWHRSNEITPVSDDPIGVGSRYRVNSRFLLWKFYSETVVSEYEENRIVAYQSSSGPYPFLLRYVFEPAGNNTRLTEIGEAELSPLMRLAVGIFIGNARRNSERGLRSLKSFLEADSER